MIITAVAVLAELVVVKMLEIHVHVLLDRVVAVLVIVIEMIVVVLFIVEIITLVRVEVVVVLDYNQHLRIWLIKLIILAYVIILASASKA